MQLKECIRNRSMAAQDPKKKFHIPYRSSKLTLMMKNCFEMTSKARCKTVIFANVAPSCADHVMTKNTLRFITPLKIGATTKVKDDFLHKPNEKIPMSWTNEMLV